ncbi:hypothetical protein IIB79_01650 [candidate division KSB1 bacterium]|nr:hypothetical protein [candidate division KSB1 bacterium]
MRFYTKICGHTREDYFIDTAFPELERRFVLQWFDKYRDYLSQMGWYEHAREWLDIKFDYLGDRKARFLTRMLLLFLRHPLKTALRLYWTWPNRHHSKSALKWYREHR